MVNIRTQRPLSFPCLFRYGLLSLAVLHAGVVEAHRVSSVSLISYLDTAKRTYVLDAAMEVVPSEEQELNDQISPEDAAREFAQEYLVVMFDRQDQKPEMEIRVEDTSDEGTPPELRRQQVLTKLTGAFPEGANEFLLYLDPHCPMAVVMVVIKDGQPSRRMQVVLAGEYSCPVSVAPLVEGDPFTAAKATPAGDSPPINNATKPEGDESRTDPEKGRGAFAAGWNGYLFGSGLPWLLTIGIFLLTLGRRSVFLQVAILLVTQSLVIALAAWKLIPLPAWAPPGLVILVVLISVEALFHHHVRWWRLPLVAAAGALSGLNIAGTVPFRVSFSRDAFGTGDIVNYLLGSGSAFVVVAVVSASILLLLSRHGWYRRAVVPPLAVILSAYAIFSSVEKFL